MVHLKDEEGVQLMREGASILGRAHGEVARQIRPGVQTRDLDKVAEEFIRDEGGEPSFKGYNGFPAALCISINDVVVHGIPGTYSLKEEDIVSVDCGVYYKGYHSDSAYTYPLEGVALETLLLLERTNKALWLGIEQAKAGNRIGDISAAVQGYVEEFGYGVVRELVGHGVGRHLHEDPEVPNFGKRGKGPKLSAGLVIAIEPMINLGTRNVTQDSDGWTIRTADRKPSAHYEHMVVVLNEKTEVLTTHKYIEENYSFKWRNKIQLNKTVQ
jgi:methionyl aminopeptidase